MLYTYEGIKNEIKSRLSLMSHWNTTLYHGVYERIIDILAYTAEKIVYIVEFLFRESRWTTARLRKSVDIMSKLLAYTSYRKSGAVGILWLSGDPLFDPSYIWDQESVFIPKWTRFTDEATGTLNVYTTQNVTYFRNTVGNQDIPVREGEPKEFLYIAFGNIEERIQIFSDSIENNVIDIYIIDNDNNILTQVNIVSNLYLVNDVEGYSCEIINDPENQFITIVFGDGINARRLENKERVLIKYADTKGAEGDILSKGIINVFKEPVYNTLGQAILLFVANDDSIVGGSEIEDIESIRNNANNLFQVGNLLSSRENWIALINSAPYVVSSMVWSLSDIQESLDSAEQNIVYVTAVNSTGNTLTLAQQNDLMLTYIYPKKSLTEVVHFEQLQKIYIRFDIKGVITNRTQEIIRGEIADTIKEHYGVLNVQFQQNVYESNYIAVINQVKDLLWHSTELFYLEKDLAFTENFKIVLGSFTSDDTSVPQRQSFLMHETFEIWWRRKIDGEWQEAERLAYTKDLFNDPSQGQIFPEEVLIDLGEVRDVEIGTILYPINQYSYHIEVLARDYSEAPQPGDPSASPPIPPDIDYVKPGVGPLFGVRNPDEEDPNGYILYISYKMEDGTFGGNQRNNLRLPRFYQITDIDEAFVRVLNLDVQ